jgi:hypothetical protein
MALRPDSLRSGIILGGLPRISAHRNVTTMQSNAPQWAWAFPQLVQNVACHLFGLAGDLDH